MTPVLPWVWFAVVQFVSLVATVLGWALLVPFCLVQAWVIDGSVDRWSFRPLNLIYGNPEDGVSGIHALIWNAAGSARVPYRPNAWAPWRAYLWSAWRNSAGGLKSRFAWKGDPFWRRQFGRWYVQAGWYPNGLPVLSAGSK